MRVSDGRHLPPIAAADRGRPGRCAALAHVAIGRREASRGAAQHRWEGGMSAPRVVVIGGGLAGITAALDCADAGAEVTLLERRARLGGLTWCFEHHGGPIDN